MRIIYCLLFTCIVLMNNTLATTSPNLIYSDTLKPRGTLGISSPELIDKYMVIVPGVGSSARDMLSEQSVKSLIMPPRDRHKNGKSYAFALASCLEFYVNVDKNYKVNLSPSYISLSVEKQTTDASIGDAFQFLATGGTVSAAIMPYGAKVISSGVYATQTYKVKNYLHITKKGDRGKSKVFNTKKALMRGNPVIAEIKITNAFNELSGKKYWNVSKGDKTSAGTQTVVVVGYDEEKKAFELLNSKGMKWGNNGYIWITYEDFGKVVENGFVLVPQEKY